MDSMQDKPGIPAALDEAHALLVDFDRLQDDLCSNLNAQQLLTVIEGCTRIQHAVMKLQASAADLLQQQFDFIDDVNFHQG